MIVPPASCPSCAPRHLRYHLALMTLEHLSKGLGCPSKICFTDILPTSNELENEILRRQCMNSQASDSHVRNNSAASDVLRMRSQRLVSYVQKKGMRCRDWMRTRLVESKLNDNNLPLRSPSREREGLITKAGDTRRIPTKVILVKTTYSRHSVSG